jgi:hypothetical protein
MILAALLALAATAPVNETYVGGLCGPVALAEPGTEALKSRLAAFSARPRPDAEADAERPLDVDAPGQLFQLPGADAPAVFIDRRRGACSLVYASATAPAPLLSELATETLPVGDKDAQVPWRRVRPPRSGPPGPKRYFLKVGESAGYGLCSAIREDLRLPDGRPATLVTVTACRLPPDEAFDNG